MVAYFIFVRHVLWPYRIEKEMEPSPLRAFLRVLHELASYLVAWELVVWIFDNRFTTALIEGTEYIGNVLIKLAKGEGLPEGQYVYEEKEEPAQPGGGSQQKPPKPVLLASSVSLNDPHVFKKKPRFYWYPGKETWMSFPWWSRFLIVLAWIGFAMLVLVNVKAPPAAPPRTTWSLGEGYAEVW